MKGGDHLYRYQIQSTTTLPMTPEEIHEIGLKEVARITAEFEKVRQEVGFKGSLHQFFEHMRTAKQFQPKSREALTQAYYAIGREVDSKIPQYFSVVPKTPLQIRPYEPFREKFEAGGSYEQGTPDGSRPGTFYFNAYDLPARSLWGVNTLFLHEGAPGHHFQISLAQENEALAVVHALRREHGLRRGLGALRGDARLRHGRVRGPLSAVRNAERRDAPCDAARRRHGHPFQGLDPRSGHQVHARSFGARPDRRDRRSRALHRHPQPGDGLQGRLPHHPAAARQGQGGTWRQVRHPRVPRAGAEHGRASTAILEQKIDRWIAAKKAA